MSRPPFNLDEILGEDHVRHYLKFITPAADNINGGANFRFDTTATLGNLGLLDDVDPEDDDWSPQPRLASGPEIECRGSGAHFCSSSTALATQPQFVWDVCEYYRLLGVTPWATRLELRKGFLARKGGTKPRLAYALKQLLNPFIRHAYDLAVPTEPFYLDNDTQEALKRRAIQEAIRRSLLTGENITQDDVLATWGMKHNKPGTEQPDEDLAPKRELPEATSQPLGDKSHALGSTISPWSLQWAWYAWHDRAAYGHGYWDPRPLEAWQRLIRSELSERGVAMSFAVGLHAGSGWKIFRTSEGMCIVFLGRGEAPEKDLAAEAVAYMTRGDRTPHANENGRRGRRSLK